MEKYNKKKENKSRKKLKTITLMLLTMLLILQINMLDSTLRKSTNTEEKSIYSLSFNQNTLNMELFGKEHQLSRSEITRILEYLKGTVKSIKDQISLVF